MSKLRKSAKGRECQIRSPYCNFNPETTVLCHLPGAGLGIKSPDIHGAFGCSDCHDYVDGRSKAMGSADRFEVRGYYHMQGVIRTQQIWLDEGLITTVDS